MRNRSEGLSISDVASLVGVPSATLRSWERRYGWPAPMRTTGTHRRYSSADVERIRLLTAEIAKGHSISDAVAAATELERRRHDRFVHQIVVAAVAMDTRQIRAALSKVERSLAPEEIVIRVALPALHEIGRRWAEQTCDVAGEHLATGEIRRMLARLLERSLGPRPARGTILLAAGPADLHTVGMEAFSVLLAQERWNPISLGALTPASSLTQAVQAIQPSATIVVSHIAEGRRAAVSSLRAVAAQRHGALFYAGNAFAMASGRRNLPGTYLGTAMLQAAEAVG